MQLPSALLSIKHDTCMHQQEHGCSAHTFADGPGLWSLIAQHRPGHILELGTGLGFTACLMALACTDSRIDSIEGDIQHAALARKHIETCALTQRVRIHEGSFSVTLAQLQLAYRSLDLAFFDGHAPPMALIRQLHSLLRHGGLLVCANLEISQPRGSRRIKAELADTVRWQPLTTLESGQTQVVSAIHLDTAHEKKARRYAL